MDWLDLGDIKVGVNPHRGRQHQLCHCALDDSLDGKWTNEFRSHLLRLSGRLRFLVGRQTCWPTWLADPRSLAWRPWTWKTCSSIHLAVFLTQGRLLSGMK